MLETLLPSMAAHACSHLRPSECAWCSISHAAQTYLCYRHLQPNSRNGLSSSKTCLKLLLLSQAFSLLASAPTAPASTASSPVQEPFTRRWSNATQWPQQAVPAQGAAVSIPAAWTVLLDTDPPPLGNLSIQGALIFSPSRCTL